MAGSSKDIIDSLIAKFHAMSDLCKAFENENGILKEQLMHQKQEMQALQSKYEELEKRYGNLKLSKTGCGARWFEYRRNKSQICQISAGNR